MSCLHSALKQVTKYKKYTAICSSCRLRCVSYLFEFKDEFHLLIEGFNSKIRVVNYVLFTMLSRYCFLGNFNVKGILIEAHNALSAVKLAIAESDGQKRYEALRDRCGLYIF